jgi:hypothetical protein
LAGHIADIRPIICMQDLTRNVEGMDHFQQLSLLTRIIRTRISKKQGVRVWTPSGLG